MTRSQLEKQILANVHDNVSQIAKNRNDQQRKLDSYVLGILLGGGNIDWELAKSVEHVCDILGLGKTTVYGYRKRTEFSYKQPKRQRRSDALEEQVWWPHAKCVMNTFWERNSDDSPTAGDPAVKHNFDSPTNHKFVEVEGNPEKKKRICVGNACESHAKWNASGCDSFIYWLFC